MDFPSLTHLFYSLADEAQRPYRRWDVTEPTGKRWDVVYYPPLPLSEVKTHWPEGTQLVPWQEETPT